MSSIQLSFLTPKNQRTESMPIPTFLTLSDSLCPNLKFVYKAKRPKSSYIKFNPKLSDKTSTGPSLGPGKYNIPESPKSMQFEFPKTERFSNSDLLAKYFKFRHLSIEEKGKINERIKKNKEEALLTKDQRQEISKKIMEKKNIRREVAKMTKEKLSKIIINKKLEKSKTKFRKYEYRTNLFVNNKQEVGQVKKSWILFDLAISIITILKYRVLNKKELKKRTARYLKIFRFSVKFIGKMIRIHVRLKYYKGMRIIQIYLSKYVVLWQKQRKKKYKKTISGYLESVLFSGSLKTMILRYLKKLKYISKCLKNCMIYQISIFQSLIYRWNKCEYQLKGLVPPAIKRMRKPIQSSLDKLSLNQGVLNIPAEIKLFYLKKSIRERLVGYIKEYKVFKMHFDSVHRQNKKNKLVLKNSHFTEYPNPPPRVRIFEEFSTDKIMPIVEDALNEKLQWAYIIFSNRGRVNKAYFQRISSFNSN